MPTYEYACRSCGEHLEVVQSFKDDALTTCPNCEGELRKVFSAAGLIFKGSGWHIKDYGGSKTGAAGRGAGSAKTESSDSGGESGTGSSSGGSGSKSDTGGESSSSSSSSSPEKTA